MQADESMLLLTVSQNIQFTTVEKLVNNRREGLLCGMLKMINMYHRHDFSISMCLVDIFAIGCNNK